MADAHRVLGQCRPVRLSLTQLFGLLVLTWALRTAYVAAVSPTAVEVASWTTLAVLWALAGYGLVRERRTQRILALVLLLCLADGLIFRHNLGDGFAVLAWFGVILAATQGHPDERRLLLRICVTSVYIFAVATKLNPSWLAGEGVAEFFVARPLMRPFQDLVTTDVATTMAALVLLVEGWLAIGLWWRRTRVATAALGIGMHTVLTVAAVTHPAGIFNLVVLNFGLVAMYTAFWERSPELT